MIFAVIRQVTKRAAMTTNQNDIFKPNLLSIRLVHSFVVLFNEEIC